MDCSHLKFWTKVLILILFLRLVQRQTLSLHSQPRQPPAGGQQPPGAGLPLARWQACKARTLAFAEAFSGHGAANIRRWLDICGLLKPSPPAAQCGLPSFRAYYLFSAFWIPIFPRLLNCRPHSDNAELFIKLLVILGNLITSLVG